MTRPRPHRRWPPGESGLLLSNRLGDPVRKSSFINRWAAAVTSAGVPAGTRFHDLRHFYASTLIAANLHPKTIQARLGHASITETLDTYGHLFPMAEEEGRGVLDAALSAHAPSSRDEHGLRPHPSRTQNSSGSAGSAGLGIP